MRTFGYAKIILVTFAVTTVSEFRKTFQRTPNGNTAGKFKGILHAGVSAELNSATNMHE